MAGQRITIQILGSPSDDGHPRLSELIKQLELINSALSNTERIITGDETRSVYFRVVDASHNSPVTFVLEPAQMKPKSRPSAVGRNVVKRFMANLRQIKRGKVRTDFDSQALEAYRGLTSMLDKHVSGLAISHEMDKPPITIDNKFKESLDKIIGADELALGSVSGRLEWLNIHNQNVFHIYPLVGPKKVACFFQQSMRSNVISAIDRYVTVYGMLKYRMRDDFPYAMNSEEIELHPDYTDLPTLGSLRGIAPNASGEIQSQEFIRSLRDAKQ